MNVLANKGYVKMFQKAQKMFNTTWNRNKNQLLTEPIENIKFSNLKSQSDLFQLSTKQVNFRNNKRLNFKNNGLVQVFSSNNEKFKMNLMIKNIQKLSKQQPLKAKFAQSTQKKTLVSQQIKQIEQVSKFENQNLVTVVEQTQPEFILKNINQLNQLFKSNLNKFLSKNYSILSKLSKTQFNKFYQAFVSIYMMVQNQNFTQLYNQQISLNSKSAAIHQLTYTQGNEVNSSISASFVNQDNINMYLEDPQLSELLSYNVQNNKLEFEFDVLEKIIIPLENIWKIEIVLSPTNTIPFWKIHYLGKKNPAIYLPIQPEIQNEEQVWNTFQTLPTFDYSKAFNAQIQKITQEKVVVLVFEDQQKYNSLPDKMEDNLSQKYSKSTFEEILLWENNYEAHKKYFLFNKIENELIFDKNIFGEERVALNSINKIEIQTFNVDEKSVETTNAYWKIYTNESSEPLIWPIDSNIDGDEICWNAFQTLNNFEYSKAYVAHLETQKNQQIICYEKRK